MSTVQTSSSVWRALSLACLLPLAVLLSSCDDESLMAPEPSGGEIFARYASIGNSITAGFQSGGINLQSQQEAYPVLLSQQMGTSFNLPALNAPGCPPPLVQVFPEPSRGTLPDGTPLTEATCGLRSSPTPTVLNNVAVPGAEVIDATTNLDPASNANALTTFILGGRTQAQAAGDVDPTFVSAWIGNNDVLDAALQGDTDAITALDAFQTRYTAMLDALGTNDDLQGGVLIGVTNVTLIPALSPGAAYFQAVPAGQQAGALPPNLDVDNSCADPNANGAVHVPFTYGATLLEVASTLFAQDPANAPTITLDCSADFTLEETVGAAFGGVSNIPPPVADAIADNADQELLTVTEIGQLVTTVQAYNAFIQGEAADRGYAFVDPNPLFTANENLIPSFPELVDNPQTPWGTDEPFGPLFSLDGVHPNGTAHQLVTNAVIDVVNDQYNTTLQPVAVDDLP